MAAPAVNPETPKAPDNASGAHPNDHLPAFFGRIAEYGREAVVYDDGWRGWSYCYSDIARMAGALVARFRAYGVHKGNTVIIWSESRPGWIAAFWACLLEGVVLVPVEPQASTQLFHRIEQKVHPRIVLLGDLVQGPKESRDTPGVCRE
jgi:acyl-CoA synthetase (AMP-forming)/AMP-acid ligase II